MPESSLSDYGRRSYKGVIADDPVYQNPQGSAPLRVLTGVTARARGARAHLWGVYRRRVSGLRMCSKMTSVWGAAFLSREPSAGHLLL